MSNMKQPWNGPIQKVSDYCYEIPRSYKSGMRVPGRIYANERLLKDIIRDRAPEQVANAAFLPGIVQYSLAMPDIHWGYGFCIGGVAATDPEDGGVITPGGVGFDINCIRGDTKILCKHGYYSTIAELEKSWNDKEVVCMNFENLNAVTTKIDRFIKIKPQNKVYKVITTAGDEIVTTEDHPFWTPDGMIPLRSLSEGEIIAFYPFEGVKYKAPTDDIIITEKNFRDILLRVNKTHKGNSINQIVSYLKKKKILPLRYNSWQLPYLLKIMGFVFGDGTISFIGEQNKGVVSFYGKEEDLEEIRQDLEKIDFTPSRIYKRERHHSIKTFYDKIEFDFQEESFRVRSSAFASLLIALGVPYGKKVYQEYSIPRWIFKATLWQKRLFLASLFGAEMSSPKKMYNYNFYPPCLSMNKNQRFLQNGKEFLRQIATFLSEFGIRVQKIGERKEFKNKQGEYNHRLRLIVSGDIDNMIQFYSQVGFEYNKKKRKESFLVLQYLKLKKEIIKKRDEGESAAVVLKKAGVSTNSIYSQLTSEYVNKRFLQRSLWEGRKTSARIAYNFSSYDEYIKKTEGISRKDCAYIWEKIRKIEPLDDVKEVYDLTVAYEDHNFVANNFVVSNCGVRLVRTNFKHSEIKDKIEGLANTLAQEIPAGLGSKGEIKISQQELRKVVVEGSNWAVRRGYGVEQDLEFTEEKGAIKEANPDKISQRAYERGKAQLGTLGSGNHFCEVQVIDEIYEPEIAEVFGLFKGQITIMIHTGSRGFGHQVCTDYLKTMLVYFDKEKLPDRQLVCAPLNSKEGKDYFSAMCCAANYAWTNRQCLMHLVRKGFEKFFGQKWQSLGMDLIYDVTHNIAKFEKHIVDGKEKTLCVHRKGATRAFPPGHPDIPIKYKSVGQPVIIPGDMGRHSFLLVGTEKAMQETFGSTCHGAGRVMSRTAAKKSIDAKTLSQELRSKGIIVRTAGRETLSEEAPQAYKDVSDVVDVVAGAGISKKVCRMKPVGVIKG